MECLNEKYFFKIKIGNDQGGSKEFVYNSNKPPNELEEYLENFCVKYNFNFKDCLSKERFGEYFKLTEKELLLLWNLEFPFIKDWYGNIGALYNEETNLTSEEICDLIIWMICFENDDVKIKIKEIPTLSGYFGDVLR